MGGASDNILFPIKAIKAGRETRCFWLPANANKLIKIRTCALWEWVWKTEWERHFSPKASQESVCRGPTQLRFRDVSGVQLDAAGASPWDCLRTEAD